MFFKSDAGVRFDLPDIAGAGVYLFQLRRQPFLLLPEAFRNLQRPHAVGIVSIVQPYHQAAAFNLTLFTVHLAVTPLLHYHHAVRGLVVLRRNRIHYFNFIAHFVSPKVTTSQLFKIR